MLTHEIKTALSVIRMAFANDGHQKKFKGHVSDAITDISDVIDRTLMADKFDSAQIEVRKEFIDLPELLKEQAAIGGVTVTSPDFFVFYSDPNLLRRILVNLIDNAKKYGHDDFPVSVALSEATIDGLQCAQIMIENRISTVGFPDPQQVFEKYYRAPHAHSRTGSGLGLYLVKHLAEILGGRVEYRALTEHVVFVLTFPMTAEADVVLHSIRGTA